MRMYVLRRRIIQSGGGGGVSLKAESSFNFIYGKFETK
jgi:hypothetical protein